MAARWFDGFLLLTAVLATPAAALTLPILALSETTLWLVRASSAAATYLSFVAVNDRPRGRLECADQLVIQPSLVEGAGLGLFARQDLTKGTVLGTYPGTVLPLEQNLPKLRQFPQCEGYIWRFSDNQFVIDPTNAVGILEDYCVGGNPGQSGSRWLFEQVLPFKVPTTLCRINEPPRGKDVNVVTQENRQRREVVFVVERDIAAGEELYIDYGCTLEGVPLSITIISLTLSPYSQYPMIDRNTVALLDTVIVRLLFLMCLHEWM